MCIPAPDSYLAPYREAQSNLGPAFGVTLWASPRTQQKRFEVFTQMCFFVGKRVLDAGCSRGDFADYLHQQDIRYQHYVGIDGLAEVVDYARGRGLPRSEFHHGDFVSHPELLSTGRPQIVAISGTLNTMDDDTARRVLEASWEAASEALIFNFLSDRTGREATAQDGPARRLSTLDLIDWALHRTWNVQFRQDYFRRGHDATILMRKE